jgi:RNA polymerase sigma-70 factor (ECF subfamily)
VNDPQTDILSSALHTDVAMTDRSRTNDLASFEQLVRQYQSYAFALALKFLCNEADATDVVQESFIRVWRQMDRYDRDQKFTTWLYRIVANLCLDRIRALNRRRGIFYRRELDPAVDDVPDERDWENIHSNEQLAEVIKSVASTLSPKQRLVFTLRDLQDLSVNEVVEITGMSPGSVKTNLHYARKTIRDLLADRYGIVRGDL